MSNQFKEGSYYYTAVAKLACEANFKAAGFLIENGADKSFLIYGAALGKHRPDTHTFLQMFNVDIIFAIRGAARAGEDFNYIRTLIKDAENIQEAIKFAAMGEHKRLVIELFTEAILMNIALNQDDRKDEKCKAAALIEAAIIGAAIEGHKQYVQELLKDAPWFTSSAVYGAALGGHKEYANKLIEQATSDEIQLHIDMAILGATEGNHTDYKTELEKQGADIFYSHATVTVNEQFGFWTKLKEEAAQGPHEQLSNTI